MSANIHVIQAGYSSRINIKEIGSLSIVETTDSDTVQKACGSCCLVRSSNSTVLFDTMGPWKKDILLEKLNSLKIHPDDVDFVIGSHGHADHIGNMNLFKCCKRQFIGICSYFKDIYFEDFFHESLNIIRHETKPSSMSSDAQIYTYKPDFRIDNNLVITATPGHTNDDVSLIINNCDNYGTVALVGDLFECGLDVKDDSIWLNAGSTNPTVQRYNRELIYSSVNWILPGHGPIFKTK